MTSNLLVLILYEHKRERVLKHVSNFVSETTLLLLLLLSFLSCRHHRFVMNRLEYTISAYNSNYHYSTLDINAIHIDPPRSYQNQGCS